MRTFLVGAGRGSVAGSGCGMRDGDGDLMGGGHSRVSGRDFLVFGRVRATHLSHIALPTTAH